MLATRSSNKHNSISITKELTSSGSTLSLSQVSNEIKNSASTSTDTPAELAYTVYMSRYTDVNLYKNLSIFFQLLETNLIF